MKQTCMNEKEAGITLLALGITIIILLILAGITISAITGEDGIIGNAGQAKEETEIANEKEIVEKATVQAMGNNKYGNIEEDELQEQLDKETGEGETKATYIEDEIEVLFKESKRYYLVDRNGNIIDFKLIPTEVKTKVTGIYLDENAKIITMDKNSSSKKAGIENNDVILEINGEKVDGSREKAIEILNKEEQNVDNQDENQAIEFVLKRGDAEVTIHLIPDTISSYYLGIDMKYAEDNFINRCINGWIETKTFVFSIFDNLKQLFTGNVGIDQMMGPVGISEVVAKTNGFREFFEMMALISLSLGVTNLLPIPALDGGKILILLIEAIRRKPLKQETEINIQLIGFAILIGIFLMVTYNDILRIF